MNITFTTLLIIFMVLVTLDKGLTIANIKLVETNYPKVNALQIERNPVARWTFSRFGLWEGTFIYWVFTIFLLLIAYYSVAYAVPSLRPYLLYVIFLVYGFVIINNTYFLLKYSQVIP